MPSSGNKSTKGKGLNPTRAPHIPCSDSRRVVSVLACRGTQQSVIAEVVGIAPTTLARHYRNELDHGREIANAEVTVTLFRMAVSGRHPAATFFWLKTQDGWRETDKVEHDHRHTGIVGHVPVPLDRLSQETLDRIEADLSRALPADASGQPD